jgi:hypothetical protein
MKFHRSSDIGKGRLSSGFLRAVTLSLLIAAFICVPAMAAPPQVVVQITQCSTVINHAGSYSLANDLLCDDVDGINIVAAT